MSGTQELAVREKQELNRKEEGTTPGRTYVPAADIYETEEALTLVLEMPGIARDAVDVSLEDDVLRVSGRLDSAKYEGMEPVYTEYNVGSFARSFRLSSKIDQGAIAAQVQDGVLTLTLPKAKEMQPRKIQIG